MAEITYLLGAGASYNALPVVDEMFDRIGKAVEWFTEEYWKISPGLSLHGKAIKPNGDEKLEKIIQDLKWLQEKCDTSKNYSIDTYARKIHLAHDDSTEFIKLKNILAFYFTIEQRRNPPDVRYDNFWASILKSRSDLPNNIKIISWNYDFQLELTYQGFNGHDSLTVAREVLNVSSQETELFDLPDSGHFGIFKLNGSATFNTNSIQDRNTKYFIDKFLKSSMADFIAELLESYEKLCTSPRVHINHLKFAWEHRTNNPFYTHLKESIKNTEILVVIGYSFPFFNRDVDKLILNDFMGNSLKKVYFQAPATDVEDIRERFLAINNIVDPKNLILRKDIKQFTLPNEL
jgi:hypothetical protein